jgi:hypothetical protein
MNPSGGTGVTITGKLVRFLRSGVKRELGASVAILAIEVDTNLDPETYYSALARFDAARTLLDAIGLSDDAEPKDVEVDLSRWPRLVLKALESEHDAELIRLESAQASGFDLPTRDVPALGCLVADIRKKVCAPPRHGRHQFVLERQLARRRTRRCRGDR